MRVLLILSALAISCAAESIGHPTDALVHRSDDATGFSDSAFTEHIEKLKERLPEGRFQVVVQKPFVVIGDDDRAAVEKWADGTVKWTVDRLKKQYFSKEPNQIIDIWLFKDKASYEKNGERIVGYKPHTPFGFYSSTRRAIVMNISTGGGTLVHEIVHPYIESNFPKCPAWFNEGLASLYEQCQDRGGRIWGLTNWRLRGLQAVIEDDSLPTIRELCETGTQEFYDGERGDNYAPARYLCYYLQEHELLEDFYHAFRKNVDSDPTGYKTLVTILGDPDMDEFEQKWKSYCLELRFRS